MWWEKNQIHILLVHICNTKIQRQLKFFCESIENEIKKTKIKKDFATIIQLMTKNCWSAELHNPMFFESILKPKKKLYQSCV